eukprot:m.165107 g.165107  ORF g.165107 m.165107 type:complete len:213 (-) comp16589_c0_seq1:46-684(-)
MVLTKAMASTSRARCSLVGNPTAKPLCSRVVIFCCVACNSTALLAAKGNACSCDTMSSVNAGVEAEAPSYGYAVLAVLLAFSLFSTRQLAVAVLIAAAAFLTRPDNKTFPKTKASSYIDTQFKRQAQQQQKEEGRTGLVDRLLGGLATRLTSTVARAQLKYVFRDQLLCKICEVRVPLDGAQDESVLYLGLFGYWINIHQLLEKFVIQDEVK